MATVSTASGRRASSSSVRSCTVRTSVETAAATLGISARVATRACSAAAASLSRSSRARRKPAPSTCGRTGCLAAMIRPMAPATPATVMAHELAEWLLPLVGSVPATRCSELVRQRPLRSIVLQDHVDAPRSPGDLDVLEHGRVAVLAPGTQVIAARRDAAKREGPVAVGDDVVRRRDHHHVRRHVGVAVTGDPHDARIIEGELARLPAAVDAQVDSAAPRSGEDVVEDGIEVREADRRPDGDGQDLGGELAVALLDDPLL